MKPINVFYSFLILISVFLFNSCIKGDPPLPCEVLDIKISFIDSTDGHDLIGDISSPYNKDSIKYIVSSLYDTTAAAKANVNHVGFYNECSLKYAFIHNYGFYKVIFLLNSTVRDTISINVIDSYKIEYFYKNKIIKKDDGDCGYLSYTIKK